MTTNRTTASAGVAAILFGSLGIVGAVMTGHPPMPEKPVADIVAWYHHHRQGVYVSQLLVAVAAAALVWFAALVRHDVAGRDGASGHAAVFSTSSAAAVALFIAGGWAQLTLAVGVNRVGESPAPASVRLLSDLIWLHWGGLTVVVAVVAASLSMVLLDGVVGARWVGGLGVVAAVMLAVGAAAGFFPTTAGKQNPIAVLGFIGFLVFALTVLLAGVTMIWGTTVRTAQPAGSSVAAVD